MFTREVFAGREREALQPAFIITFFYNFKSSKMKITGREIKKTVLYNGNKIKVLFDTVVVGGINEGIYTITKMKYFINGKEYPIIRRAKQITCNNGSVGYSRDLTFEGVTIPDNDKKMIELILNVKGL